MKFIKELIEFIKNVSQDERIPQKDKAVLAALVALLISPFDIIPDWIPVLGLMDDFIVLAVILDYLFKVLDQEILLSHYPWSMKSYSRMKLSAKTIAMFAPDIVKNRIWSYVKDPYKG